MFTVYIACDPPPPIEAYRIRGRYYADMWGSFRKVKSVAVWRHDRGSWVYKVVVCEKQLDGICFL